MTNFANDLLRAFDTISGVETNSLGGDFFLGEPEYWTGFHRVRKDSSGQWVTLDEPVPYDDTPEAWKNMNVSFELMEFYGGEGQGDQYWKVYKFTDNNTGEEVLIKFDGWYASYNGAEYETCFVVKPVEKVVTFYE